MIVYEYPLNEHIRTLLKLERLYQQGLRLIRMDDAISHQNALFTIFDLFEITARNEIRTDLQMELARLRQAPDNQAEADRVLGALHALPSRLDQALRDEEWLVGVKQRANIPGGINGFDLPYLQYWQHQPGPQRQADLLDWITPTLPIYQALGFVLKRLRERGGVPKTLIAQQGFHQQMLDGRSGRLLRIGLAEEDALIPEASANRYAITIRFLSPEDATCVRCSRDIEFQLCLCLS